MTTSWDAQDISAVLTSAFAPGLSGPQAQKPTGKNNPPPPTATIDVLITFDAGGVSGHPNHASLYRGALAFAAALVRGRPGWRAPVDVYALTTVALARKYVSFLDVAATLLAWALRTPMRDRDRPAGLVFLSGYGTAGYGAARLAMTAAQRSQMVWFRYGWITFSRYMFINDLRLEKIKST